MSLEIFEFDIAFLTIESNPYSYVFNGISHS